MHYSRVLQSAKWGFKVGLRESSFAPMSAFGGKADIE
jgi:hypothetical protein